MDDQRLVIVAAIAMSVIVVITAKAIQNNEKEQKRITNETIKVLGEYRQYLADLAKNN